MRRELTKPGWLILIIFILWGIAGKLDEPLKGFDPEPTTSAGDETGLPPIHLLCYLDQGHDGRDSPRSGDAVLQVHADITGFHIARLNSTALGNAMACGLLYTETLQQ